MHLFYKIKTFNFQIYPIKVYEEYITINLFIKLYVDELYILGLKKFFGEDYGRKINNLRLF